MFLTEFRKKTVVAKRPTTVIMHRVYTGTIKR